MLNSFILIQALANFPEIIQECSSYFSQGGEDLAIDIFLRNETTKGIFLDVGAYHPFRFSNTMLLYLQGWRGINVDGNEQTIELFKKYRTDEINIHALVSDREEEIDFFKFPEGAWNTTNAAAAQELNSRGQPECTISEVVKLKTTPLSSILDAYVGDKKFDFLNIDIEGLDLRIFYSIDFSRYRPKIICLEIGIDEWNADPFKSFIRERGYAVVSQCVNSAILQRIDAS